MAQVAETAHFRKQGPVDSQSAVMACHWLSDIYSMASSSIGRYHTLLVNSWDFYQHGLTLIPAWISDYIHYNVWHEFIIHTQTSFVGLWMDK